MLNKLLDQTSRLVIAYHVGKRDQENTDAFIADLRSRLLVMPALFSDGFPAYPWAVAASFGRSVDYAQLHKIFRAEGARDDDYRTEQPRNPIVTKHAIFGAPDMASASTSYTERNNGTMRHHIGRMRRMIYAFSRKLDHHRAAVALNYAWYNFACVVRTLRVSPAMAAGLTDHIWSPEEFMDVVLSEQPSEAPTAKPLRLRTPKGTARELPGGRGFLRVVQGGKSPSPAPTPEATPVPVAPAMAPPTAQADDRQLSLLDWRPYPAKPSPPKGTQLSLFDKPEE